MTEELKALLEAEIELKRKQELETLEKRINADKEVISKAVELINTHTLYKKISKNNHYVYELATEAMFKDDYMREPKYKWKKGVNFRENEFNEKINRGVIEVNGETYYDIRYALNSYERYIDELKSSLDCLKDQIKEKEKEMALLNKNFPTLKKAIEEWQKYECEDKKNDSN